MAELTGAARAGLIISAALFAEAPAEPATGLCLRFRAAGVALAALGTPPSWLPSDLVVPLATAPWSAGMLLRGLRQLGADPGSSWLVTREEAGIAAAGSAGLAGVVLVGASAAPPDEGVWVRLAPDLASVPIALVPRGGGCWHQR
jgi:hypothetical protein